LLDIGEQSTVVLAKVDLAADLIAGLGFSEGVDDGGANKRDDIIASSGDFSREKSTELLHNEIIDVFVMDVSVLFTHTDKDGADNATGSVIVLGLGSRIQEADEMRFSQVEFFERVGNDGALVNGEGHAGQGAGQKAEESKELSHVLKKL